jgi:hypothetical protein
MNIVILASRDYERYTGDLDGHEIAWFGNFTRVGSSGRPSGDSGQLFGVTVGGYVYVGR